MRNHFTQTTFSINHVFSILLIIIFTVISLSGCSSTSDRIYDLEQASRGYEKALRWSKYDMAYSYFKWDSSEQPSIPAYLNNIRLTKYRTANRNFNEETMTATQTVTMRYYNQNDLREKTLEDKQEWKYFKDENRWYLISEPPEFK